jgi:hypothetical protein
MVQLGQHLTPTRIVVNGATTLLKQISWGNTLKGMLGSLSLGVFSCLLTTQGQANPSQAPSTPSMFASGRIQQTVKVKKENLKADLQSCVRQGESAQCIFFLSSTKEDFTIWVAHPNRAKSRIVDKDGNEYGTFQILRFGVPDTSTMIVRKAPIKLVIQFDQLPASLTSAVLVEVGLETYGRELAVRFQNVSLPNGVFQFQPPPPPEPGIIESPPSSVEPEPPAAEEEPGTEPRED